MKLMRDSNNGLARRTRQMSKRARLREALRLKRERAKDRLLARVTDLPDSKGGLNATIQSPT